MNSASRLMSSINQLSTHLTTSHHGIEADESPTDQQYHIPPPEDDHATLFGGIHAILSMRFMSFSLWVSGQWQILY